MIVDNFENIILDLERRKENMRNIFDRADKNIERINETDVWTSPAEREFYSKYKELSSNYNEIINGINSYINFLRNALSNYKTLENTTNQDIDSNSTTLDVNS